MPFWILDKFFQVVQLIDSMCPILIEIPWSLMSWIQGGPLPVMNGYLGLFSYLLIGVIVAPVLTGRGPLSTQFPYDFRFLRGCDDSPNLP